MISFEDFQKIELRVVKVLEASRVDGSDKLLKLSVAIGEESPRTIIAGIGKVYNPEYLVGKEILVIANLEPRTIMGIESQGMILATSDRDGRPTIMVPEREVDPGSNLH